MTTRGIPEHAGLLDEDAQRELLTRHVPRVRFDSLECLRPTRVEQYLAACVVLNGRNVPDGRGDDLPASATPRYRLDPLSDARPADDAEGCSDALLAKFGPGADRDAQGTCYGRVTPGRRGTFLQYWFFYVDNPCVLPPGRHDADWEFVQLRLAPEGHLTHVTVAQHGGPETRGVVGVQRPEVFVAVGSHASYLTSGTQPKIPLSDECDAEQRPERDLIVALFPGDGWPDWPGLWGLDRGLGSWLATGIGLSRTPWLLSKLNGLGAGDSPTSPGRQGQSWKRPAAFQRRGGVHRFTRVVVREFLHWLGWQTWPRAAPAVTVTRPEPQLVSIDVRPSGRFMRRVRRISVLFRETGSGRPLGTHSFQTDGGPHHVQVPAGTSLEWCAAGYNRLRQRGYVTDFRAV